MDALTIDEALVLARLRGGDRISLVMPTRRFAPGSQEEDTTRLRNLLKIASEALTTRGLKAAEADRLLAPAYALAEDRPFWLRSTEALALLIGPEGLHSFRLNRAVKESVVVNDRYHVRPLLALIGASGPFWLLAMSQNHVRLYEGSRSVLTEVPAEGVPESLADAMKWDNFEKDSLQFHSGSGGRGPAVFHGTGETAVKDELVRYFRAIDHGLRDHLRDSSAPLILAGVDYLLPLYREVNTYQHLTDDAVTGNPDSLTEPILHQRAIEILDHLTDQGHARLAAQVEEAWGSPKTTPDLEAVIPAAHHGRVDTLLLAEGEERPGAYDAATGRVTLRTATGSPAEDLLDLAALYTLENGGSVVTLDPGQMPHNEAVIALLRY